MLNEGQSKAANEFLQFMLSDEKEYIISGPAGSGKTYLLDHIMSVGMKEYEDACKLLGIPITINSMHLTATTNKAAEVLANATNLPTQTIHSFLNLKVKENFETGQTFLSKLPNYMIHNNKLIFIDECSQIDSMLYKILQESVINCKIVYIGDHFQLAPVFEKLSPIYKKETLFSQLTQPMRNASQPALMALCNQLRDTVETGVFMPIMPVPGVIEHLDGPQMEAGIYNTFINPDNKSRVLCYSNNKVNEYNDHIRAIRGYGAQFQPGEKVISASAHSNFKYKISIEQEFTVESVDSINSKHFLQNAEIEFYTMVLRDNTKGRIQIKIPVNKKHYQDLLKYFSKNKNWSNYFQLKDMFPDIRPRDASTVYKAQGSTYDTVFVDLNDINKCKDANQVARMLYVAVSRPKYQLFLYGKLKPAYGGI